MEGNGEVGVAAAVGHQRIMGVAFLCHLELQGYRDVEREG